MKIKLYVVLILLVILSVYLVVYVLDEIRLGGVTTGLYLFFNVPLVALQLFFSIYLFTRKIKWLQIISVIGMIIAGLTLIPPTILYLIF